MNPPDITLRQYAAIHLMIPDSGIEWLDTMIDQAREQHYAAKHSAALSAALARITDGVGFSQKERYVVAEAAIDQANQITHECDRFAEYHEDTLLRSVPISAPATP